MIYFFELYTVVKKRSILYYIAKLLRNIHIHAEAWGEKYLYIAPIHTAIATGILYKKKRCIIICTITKIQIKCYYMNLYTFIIKNILCCCVQLFAFMWNEWFLVTTMKCKKKHPPTTVSVIGVYQHTTTVVQKIMEQEFSIYFPNQVRY